MRVDLRKDIPDKFKDLLFNRDRFLILKGSAGSGKSVFATKKLVFRSIYEQYAHRHLILRKVAKDIEESIFSEVKQRVSEWGLKNRVYYREMKSPHKIWLKDSLFMFVGLDDSERIKSISKVSSITMEEMTEFDETDFDQLNLRLRGEMPVYKQTIGMFNPIDEDHWTKKRFVDSKPSLPTTFHESTYLDNPFLDEEYKQLLESYKETNKYYYDVYCLGKWGVVDKSNKFLYSYSDDLLRTGLKEDTSLSLRLSFDFNIDPFVCYVYQRIDSKTVRIFDRVRLNDSDITQITDQIKAKYPGRFYICTGDVTGKNRSGATRGKISYWYTIKKELGLTDNQIRLRSKNLDLIQSRVLCNSVVQNLNVEIDESLAELISDLKFSKVDDYGILIKDRKDNKCDDLDAFRYILDAEFPDIIVNPKKYR